MTTSTSGAEAVSVVHELTEGLGADVAIEAVGVPETFELCAAIVRPGGRVANVGVHSAPATLRLEDLWIRNVTITTGLVDTYSMPTLIRLVQGGRLDMAPLITHRFDVDDLSQAYAVFADAGRSGALKVVVTRSRGTTQPGSKDSVINDVSVGEAMMNALIVYESMLGDTRRIADAVADGLRRSAGCSVVEVRDAPTVVDHDVDLLVVGAPTHAFGLSTRETRREAQQQFRVFADRWQSKYPAAVELWRSAWTEFIPFLDYDPAIRRVICLPTPSRV